MEDLVKNLKSVSSATTVKDLEIFLPHEIKDGERGILFEKFSQSLVMDSPRQDDVFSILYNYFSENEFSQYFIEKYSDTYWSFFVRLGWQLLHKLKDNIFVDFVARTLPYATSEHINVKDKLLTELFLMEPAVSQSVYQDIKKLIYSLDYPISFSNDGKKVTISDLIKQYSNQQQVGDLARLGESEQIQKILFPSVENDAEEVKESTVQSTKDFIELISFFANDIREVSEYAGDYYRNRPEVADLGVDKEFYGQIGAGFIEELSIEEKIKTGTEGEIRKVLQSPQPEAKKNFVDEIQSHKADFIGWTSDAGVLREMLDWLKTFESKEKSRIELLKLLQKVFNEKDLEDTELVSAVLNLNEFLSKNGYPGEDFIHFDEKDEKFKWEQV